MPRMLILLVLALGAGSEPFVLQPNVLPGPAVWTEGVCSFDADDDGDLDLAFANCVGFDEPEAPLPPTLLVNGGVKDGNPTFADDSVRRLPATPLYAKNVIAFDKDGDGDLDLVFAQAYGHVPVLLDNNGRGAFENTSRDLPQIELNSWGACAGDVDLDGDFDLAFAHHGGRTLFSGDGLRTQLWTNSDKGHFVDETAARLPEVKKLAQQNATFVDLDQDFDLDLVVDGRSAPQRAYLNDGHGIFTSAENAIPAGTPFTYETEFADLDGDTDLDAFYISMKKYDEGVATSKFAESGKLAFDEHPFDGSGDDDNEAAFLDYDDDGDLDVIVGTLAGAREKLWRNDGDKKFVAVEAFSELRDSTLDLALGDFDGDGDVDVVTAQGESGAFENRYYRNEGPRDTKPPRILKRGFLAGSKGSPGRFFVLVQDGAADDGACTAHAIATFGSGAPGAVMVGGAMRAAGGGLFFWDRFSTPLPKVALVQVTDAALNEVADGPFEVERRE